MEVDLDARCVRRHGRELALTNHEFNILAWLAERQGCAVDRTVLAVRVLTRGGAVSPRTVASHVCRLREKLGGDAAAAVRTVRGVGYRFDVVEPR